MILDRLRVAPDAFAEQTGWDPKPQGLCRGEVCVPAPGAVGDDGLLDVELAAGRLGMPLVRDEANDVWALGPATANGKALATAQAADPELIDRAGNPFRLSSLRGRKVLLVAWASY